MSDLAELVLIDVPFDGFGRVGHQASAPAALRGAGLLAALTGRRLRDAPPLDLPAPEPAPGPLTCLRNEAALLAMTEQVGTRVRDAVGAGAFPLVHGADCSTLLGTVPALRADGPIGLVFVDGHEDGTPVADNPDGEAANSELALLLGLSPPGPWADRLPALDPADLAVLGTRDADWRAGLGVASLSEAGVAVDGLGALAADPEGVTRAAVERVRARTGRWWLHVDLDVLDPDVFVAQGLPDVPDDPGGLTWERLTRVLTTAVGVGGVVGWSVTIYDPQQDPGGDDARRIVRLVSDVVAALPPCVPF